MGWEAILNQGESPHSLTLVMYDSAVAILAKGRRVARPPFHISKKEFNTILPSFSSPTQENIFVCILPSVKV